MVRADSRAMSDLHERVTRVWQGGVGPAASRALDVAARGYRGLLDAREWLYGRGVLRCRALGVGLLSGGYGPDELRQSGAFRVYDDPADMLRRIDEVGGRR